MAPMKRTRRDEGEDEDVIAVESASSMLRNDSNNKKPRLSVNSKISRPANGRPTSVSPPSSDDSDSDSNDDEQRPNTDTEGTALPQSTQYEQMRDNGFSHLIGTANDDKIAEERFLKRRRTLGDNRPSENAIIEKITCINFMCHTKLVVDLGPLINFVVGMNGSGKSAVLTAITLCLGGKASATNRGGSLKTLIKEGQEQAILIIKLKNQGSDAYQPDTYGESIIVERHFSRSGSSSFKLRSGDGKRLISSKKIDVEDIVEYYQLQVDNPMNVLTQDAAKSFITSSTPADKYDFFVKGVQLEALDNDYKMVSDTVDSIESRLHDSQGDNRDLKKKAEAAQAKAELVQKHSGMRAEYKRSARKLAWIQVAEVEAELEQRQSVVADAQMRIEDAERDAENKDQEYQATDQAVDRAKEALSNLEQERTPLEEEEEVCRAANDAVTEEVKALHTQQQSIRTSLTDAKTKVTKYNADIEAEQQRLHAANGGAPAQKLEDVERAQRVVQDAKVSFQESEKALPRLQDKLRAQEDRLRGLEEPLKRKAEDYNIARNRLDNINSDRGNVMAGYHPNMTKLLKAIENDRGFREKPVGPMGLHIKLLLPRWSNILESKLNSALNGFVVTSKSDQTHLARLLNQHGLHFCSINIISSRAPINIAGNEPDPQFATILRALSIENELVKKALIINQAIEQIILIESRAEAMRAMYDGPRPRNVKVCFATHDSRKDYGHSVGFNGNGRDFSPINPVKGKGIPRMKADLEGQVAFQRDLVEQAEQERSRLNAEYSQVKEEANSTRNAIQLHKRNHQKLKIAVQKAEEKVDRLQAELDNLTVTDGRLDGLKELLKQSQKALTIAEESYGNVAVERSNMNATALEKKRALSEAKDRLAEFDFKLGKAQARVKRAEQARTIALGSKNAAIDSITVRQDEKATAERKVQDKIQHLENFTASAQKVCDRVPLDPGDTGRALDAKCETLKKRLDDYAKAQGATDEEVNNAAIQTRTAWQAAVKNRKELEELLQLLKKSFTQRLDQYRYFQKYISSSSRINFVYLLSERAFRGRLMIDHVNKTLDVHVEPDETSRTGKGRATKTLSGGEKSFSSICLLLSLWEAMGAPLRCLDEFDVFMDDVNRDVSTKMIISAARRAVGRQFILITPKALGAGIDMDKAKGLNKDVSITKLQDPRKQGQRTITEMVE